jgi:hypothetical protein
MIIPIIATVASETAEAGTILKIYLPFEGLGLLLMVATLALLFGLCFAVGMWFGRASASKPAAPTPTLPAAAAPLPTPTPTAAAAPLPPTAPPEDAADPRIVAAIAAAVTVTLNQPYRIIDIQAAGQPVGMTSAWAIEGRFQHFSSHKIR